MNVEDNGSGGALTRRSKVGWPHDTIPGGGFFFWILRTFLSCAVRAAAFAAALWFSMTWSGARAMTVPIVSKPARPARPPIWWNSRAVRRRVDVPSYLARAVKTTVRMGTLMPTPRVSVPQMTFSSPAWASCSTRRRYLGNIPAWCTPMPWRTNLASVLPNPDAKRNPPMSSAIWSFSARVSRLTLISDCARSTADAWVK